MDKQTANVYNQHAHDMAAAYRRGAGGIRQYFSQAFAPGELIVDIGSGSDLKAMLDSGCDITGDKTQ